MRLAPFLTAAAALLVILLAVILKPASSEKQKYEYVGMSECAKCHGTGALGNQVAIWQGTPHARAARVLRTERASIIAKKLNIENPSEAPECLKCHTTGGGKVVKLAAEGVGCEACHGPASAYGDITNHAPYGDREKDYARAVSFGMYKTLGIDGIKLRERMCKRCHTLNRPCAPEDAEERKRQELALSVIADFIYRHPVRSK
ncbi:MAG TPA: cytochrome c family protein [Spirochaetota bacterium]|nr:cytochrome c family protein [Spirochaetota bacterium]